MIAEQYFYAINSHKKNINKWRNIPSSRTGRQSFYPINSFKLPTD